MTRPTARFDARHQPPVSSAGKRDSGEAVPWRSGPSGALLTVAVMTLALHDEDRHVLLVNAVDVAVSLVHATGEVA